MRKLWLVLGSALLALSGCVDSRVTVKVKPDGTGTMEQTVLVSKKLVSDIRLMTNRMNGGGSKGSKGKAASSFLCLDEDQLRQKALSMGEGVTYISSLEVDRGDKAGYTVCYSFRDIRSLRINSSPGSVIQASITRSENAEGETALFDFIEGVEPTLIIRLPGEADVSRDVSLSGSGEKLGPEQAKALGDLRIAIFLEIDGSILETNAFFRDGSRITLLDIDFSRLVSFPEKLRSFNWAAPSSFAQAKALLKDVPGVRVDPQDLIRVKFK